MGAVQLCDALGVASGVPCARPRAGQKGPACQACLREWLQSALCASLQGVQLMLENGSLTPRNTWGRGLPRASCRLP